MGCDDILQLLNNNIGDTRIRALAIFLFKDALNGTRILLLERKSRTHFQDKIQDTLPGYNPGHTSRTQIKDTHPDLTHEL